MLFSELKTALAARGFDDYSDTTLGERINSARAELDRMYLWPWREASVTGTAPASVSDLGQIEAVTNETRDYRLVGRQFADLIDAYGDLSTTGTPIYYYRAYVSNSPVVATYPVSTDTIGVQYWKVTVDLVDAGDEPASPSECHSLIVDLAAARGWRDKDNHELAAAIQADVSRQIEALLFQYAPGVADDRGEIIGGSGW